MKKRIMAKVLSAVCMVTLVCGMLSGCASAKDDTAIKVGAMSGPTAMSMVKIMEDSSNGQSLCNYEFGELATDASAFVAPIAKGELDIACIPSNLASVIYNKTEGGVLLLNINTLGVLYCVTGDASITSIKDLSGRKVITTGQGATPEYSLRYLLDQNGITDCEIEFKSESTEVAAVLSEDPSQIAVLPQPFVTVACAQNEAIAVAFSLEDEWQSVTGGLGMVTGVTVVRNDFLKAHPEAVKTFIKEHSESVNAANSDLDTTASLVVANEIIGKEPLAKKAIPFCNVVCMTGDSVKNNLAPYLEVLYNSDPKSVGGKLPGDEFYYKG